MPSTRFGGESGRSLDKEPVSDSTPLWKRPIIWVGGIILAAFGAAITGWLQPRMSDALNKVTETGEPVIVSVERQTNKPGTPGWPPDVSLPPDVVLDEEDLTALSAMSTREQIDWYEQQGGVPTGTQVLRIALKGNRADPVRITDMAARTECEEPPLGSIVINLLGRGANNPSTVLFYDIDESPEGPYTIDPETNTQSSFFPNTTISLQKDEVQYIVAHLIPQYNTYCHVHLEMMVEYDGETSPQRIPGEDESITLIPIAWQLEQDYQQAYVGGELCENVILAPPVDPYHQDPNYPCGEGNLKQQRGPLGGG